MTLESMNLLGIFGIVVVLLLIIGFYYILVTRNLIRILIGMEILSKAVTLAIIIIGFVTGKTALAQSLVIIIIIIEVFVIAVAASIIIDIYKHTDSIDKRNIMNLKG